jgi:YYY domain-containing protein
VSDLEAILRWYIVLTLIAAAMFPFVSWLGARLGPARFGLLRPLSLVALTALLWWPADVFGLPYARRTLVIALVVAGVVGWLLWFRHGISPDGWPALLAFEALWLAMFLGYAWFRSYYPDIINTEKPMEMALLTSVSRSSDVPAPDPWFAGSAINYYYFGFQSIATIVKLSSVPTSTGFNLALATLFASGATVAAAAGATLMRALGSSRRVVITGAALAVVLLLLAGNLETARRLIDDSDATIDAGWWDGVGWQASRVIYDNDVNQPGDEKETINEFPAFSYVLGDLHPHVLTYPLLAAVLVLALSLALSREPESLTRLATIGALVGLLYASNSWDAPAGMLLVAGALAIKHRYLWRQTARDLLIVAGGALLMAGPFILEFSAPIGVANSSVPGWLADLPLIGRFFNTFAIVSWRPSSVRELLLVHGAWLAAFAGLAATELVHDRSLLLAVRRRPQVWLAVGILAFGVAMAWAPAVLLLGVPLALALWFAVRSDQQPVRVVAGLFAAGFLLALIPEFIYIQDVFNDRMNTVFKLFYQAWLLLSIASAAAIIYVATQVPRSYRVTATAALGLLVLLTLPYTPLSAQDWTNDFATRSGLNGRAYLRRSAPGDLAAIDWIAANAEPGDTIVEQPGCSYINAAGAPMSRVSTFSGVPTIIGWHGHESQWRRGEYVAIRDILDLRAAQANAILDGTVTASETDARFVVLGRQEIQGTPDCNLTVERTGDPAATLRSAGWEVAFESGQTTIFSHPGDPSLASLR